MTDTATKKNVLHFKTRIEDLIPIIGQGGQMAKTSGVHPIYESVKLTVDQEKPGVIRVESTDLEVFHIVERHVDGLEILGSGSLCVSKRELLGLLRSSKKGPLVLEQPVGSTGDVLPDLRMLMEGSEFTITGAHVADFPEIPKAKDGPVIKIPVDEFAQAVRRTEMSAAVERMRYALNGILVTFEKDQCVVVSTDGRRLSKVCVSHEVEVDGDVNEIIPTTAMRNAAKWIPKKKATKDLLSGQDAVRIATGNGHVEISYGDFTVVSRVVEGKFPSFNQVIPKKTKNSALFNKSDIETALTHALRCVSRDAPAVRLEFRQKEKRVHFRVQTAEKTFHRPVPAYIEGGDVNVGFNPQFLMDALKVHDGESVQLSANGSGSPSVMTYEGWTYVCMPVSLE